MNENIEELLKNIVEGIPQLWKKMKEFEYKKISLINISLYFIYETSITTFKGKISSVETKPIAIITEENEEYILCPLNDEKINKEEILKDFVDKMLI